jgi:ferritin-like metal-binding protein YciE
MAESIISAVKEKLGVDRASTLEELFVEQLQDLYSAETQLIKALPLMAKASANPELKAGFEHHLEQTKGHAGRLEQILAQYNAEADGRTCKAMEGLVKEGSEAINEYSTPEFKDAALIAAAQRVEHYEIAGYGTVRTYATLLADAPAEELLSQTLSEESQTDEKLTALAQSLNLKPGLKKRGVTPVKAINRLSESD